MNDNKLRIGITGSQKWIDYFAEAFGDDEDFNVCIYKSFNKEIYRSVRRLDLIYVMFGWLDKTHLLIFLEAFLRKIPTVVHWFGTDVYIMINTDILSSKMKIKRLIMKFLFKIHKNCYHISGAPWLKEELKSIGISSTYIPSIYPLASIDTPVYPLPETLIVLSYIPLGRENFYGEEKLIKIAKNNPDINFIVVANSPDRKPKDLNNVEYYSWVSLERMEELYRNSTCVLRLTKHDGLGGTIIEMLLRGRYGIFSYNHPHPYVYKATNCEEVQKALDEIKTKKDPNFDGARFVKENYSTEIVKEKIKKFFFEILKGEHCEESN